MEALGQPGGYGQFCPVAMAAEILCTKWTALVVRELCVGSTRFNELRKGVPRMSPTLLSKRLKELEKAGVITHTPVNGSDVLEYHLTPAGEELRPIIVAMGVWGKRWVETKTTLKNLDPTLLMWDMRRSLNLSALERQKSVIQFVYHDLAPLKQNHWLVIEPPEVDICYVDPGFNVDLYIMTDLHTMTSIWMGITTVDAETQSGRLELTGDAVLRQTLPNWLGLSLFAPEKGMV